MISIQTKRLFPLIISAIACMSHTSATGIDNRGKFTINGHIANMPDSCNIHLIRSNGQLGDTMTEVPIINGSFQFTAETDGNPETLYIISLSPGFPNYRATIWVAPGEKIEVTGDGKLMPLWHVASKIPQQQSHSKMVHAKMPEFKRYLELNAEESALLTYLYREKKGAEEYIKPVWAKIDSIRAISDQLDSIMNAKTLDYMATAPVDCVWLEEYRTFVTGNVLGYLTNIDRDKLDALYGRLTEEDLNTADGQAIKQYLSIGKLLGEGDEMTDGVLYDTDGNKHTLSEHAGKYMLLDFWSAGCGPCIQSIPEAEEVAEMYADRLAFISISTDPEDAWKRTVEKRNMKGIQWNELKDDAPGLAEKYGTSGIPHYVLINPEGIIVKEWAGYGKGSLKSALSPYFNK